MSTTQDVMTTEKDNSIEPALQTILFSSYAHLHPSKSMWRVQVQGQAYRDRPLPFSKRFLLRGLTRALKLTPEQSQSELFQSRVRGFMATPETGKRFRVQHGPETFRIRQRSRRSGLFQGRFDLPISSLSCANDTESRFDIQLSPECGDAIGSIFLAGRSGVSIISDIDDTIKQTDVTSRTRMLTRTFVEEFESIDGMAALYQHWAEQGGMFHYVSSSPWQIYRPLENFLAHHDFPSGSMHLKWFRLRDEFFKRWRIIRRKSKAGVIAQMMKRMPYRKFLLVGDSGERDPEIYTKIARRFPEQVLGILIRDLKERPIDGKRHESLIKRLDSTPLTLFCEPSEIADSLDRAKKLS
jgi:phosphatidate phosphatase APP1